MNIRFKHIAAAAMFVAAGVAQAASVTVPAGTGVFDGLKFTGSGSLAFSGDLLGALDTGKVSVAAYGDATATVLKDTDGFYTEVSASAPITALTIDDTTKAVLGAATTGGATQTAPVLKSVSSGGSLTVTDLNVDLANKKVYATLIGGNGVGTLTNFYLWDIANISGATSVSGPGVYTTTLTGLSITTDGFNALTKSLGLLNLGKAALSGVSDFGTITSTITATAVPEPSTYALAGVGLAMVGLMRRRKQASK
jgi:hypothetical protein